MSMRCGSSHPRFLDKVTTETDPVVDGETLHTLQALRQTPGEHRCGGGGCLLPPSTSSRTVSRLGREVQRCCCSATCDQAVNRKQTATLPAGDAYRQRRKWTSSAALAAMRKNRDGTSSSCEARRSERREPGGRPWRPSLRSSTGAESRGRWRSNAGGGELEQGKTDGEGVRAWRREQQRLRASVVVVDSWSTGRGQGGVPGGRWWRREVEDGS